MRSPSSCLGLLTGRLLGWGLGAFPENQAKGEALEVAWGYFCHILLAGAAIGLAGPERRAQRSLLPMGEAWKNWGSWFPTSTVFFDFEVLPPSTVTLKEGAPTRDPRRWTLGPSYTLLHAQESDLRKFT